MIDPSEQIELLSEYLQWKSAREVARPDLSPEEFMRDRLKQVAFDRVEDALDYINQQSINGYHPDNIKAILEGTYVEQSNGAEVVGEEPPGEIADSNTGDA